mmetsp:Transcript_21655/g.32322  ORF Transcript_21655/g.32322 Transcript_21655/m.32322 type:complete len:321 (-) Transcript_21655:256-1218(-)
MSIPKPDDLQTLLKKMERHLHITPTPSNNNSSSGTNKNNKCFKYDHQKQTQQVEEPADAAAVRSHNRNKDLEGGVGISSLETVTAADGEDYLQMALDLLFEQSERTLCICNNVPNDRSQSSLITLLQKYDTNSSNNNSNRNKNNSNGEVLDDIIDRKHTQMVLKQQNRPHRQTKQTSTTSSPHSSVGSINTASTDVIHSNSQLGLINLKLQNFKKAVICFERALEAANQKWPFGHYNVMILRECIADSCLLQKNYVKARQEYTLMKSVFEIIGTHSTHSTSSSDNNNCRQLSVRVLQKLEYSNTKLKEQSDERRTQAFLY